MKTGFKTMITGMAMLGIAGCAQSPSGSVSTSLTMTGSSQAATVAKYKINHPWLSFLMPTAVALTPPSMTDSTGLNVTLNKAWVVVKEIEFKPNETAESSEVDGDEVKFRGPYVVDLLAVSPAPFGEAELPTGVYRRIKMKLDKDAVLPAEAPVGLSGNSIYFEATVAGNQITYSAADGTEFQIGGAGGINLNDNANLLVTIRLADLFKMIDLSGISSNVAISESNRVAGTNLCPLIDASAQDLYTCIRKGLEKSGKFGKDDDGDHEIEAGEDEVEG